MIERIFILKRTEIFGALPHDVLGNLAAHMEEVRLDPGETLFKKGDLGRSLFVVVDGLVRVHIGEETIAELGSDEVLGEVTALTSEVRRETVTAEEETRLLRLDQDVLYELMAGRPAMSRGIIKVLVERLK
jgi:CRP/FNR family transcriptional regulator, cyclic AMP receptor protein